MPLESGDRIWGPDGFSDGGRVGIGRRRPLGASAAGLGQWNGVASWVGGRCGRERSMDPF